jgi:hypothetical protein
MVWIINDISNSKNLRARVNCLLEFLGFSIDYESHFGILSYPHIPHL